MLEYSARHFKTLLHGYRAKIGMMRLALQRVRARVMAKGATEEAFAAACGVSLDELHELIGSHEDWVRTQAMEEQTG